MDSIQDTPEAKRPFRAPVIAAASAAALLAAGYLGLCAFAANTSTFFPNFSINGVEVGGLTASEASQKLARELPARTIAVQDGGSGETLASVTLEQLGCTATSADGVAEQLYRDQKNANFLTGGWRLIRAWTGTPSSGWYGTLTRDEAQFSETVSQLSSSLSYDALNTTYEMGDAEVLVTMAKDGRSVSETELRNALTQAAADTHGNFTAVVSPAKLPARTKTAQEIHDEVAGELKNAGYDPVTDSIIPEQAGAEFDVASAQSLMNAAAPGTTVSIPAKIEMPAVTAEQLKEVLFRDKLGSYTTHVSGTAARISNVKLASSAVDGVVLNSGEVFNYNNVVGQRTTARGYRPAPAYVKGETVDEIGGGVCQPSSTLYLATLLSNLEIVTRYAHRYVPAYIPKGMDATVSWGGPEFEFRNNTDYPIRIEAVYAKNYLTMTIYGTKTDDTYVKMTNRVLSTTPFEVVYQDDPTLPAGTEQVKVTPYTGYKVETYRNVYAGDGTLLSSKLEAVSDYKVRNRIILRGPSEAAGTEPLPQTPGQPVTPQQPENPGSSVSPEDPGQTATQPENPGQVITPQPPDKPAPETPTAQPEEPAQPEPEPTRPVIPPPPDILSEN